MKVLLVDDNSFKRNYIYNYIVSLKKGIIIDTALSIESGISKGLENDYDLLLLDMDLPQFDQTEDDKSRNPSNDDGKPFKDGGKIFKNGGEFIAEELIEENKDFLCSIITQYDRFSNGRTIEEIDKRLQKLCGSKYLGYIKFNIIKENWKETLKKTIENVENIINR